MFLFISPPDDLVNAKDNDKNDVLPKMQKFMSNKGSLSQSSFRLYRVCLKTNNKK
jgi:hypothetical protein